MATLATFLLVIIDFFDALVHIKAQVDGHFDKATNFASDPPKLNQHKSVYSSLKVI